MSADGSWRAILRPCRILASIWAVLGLSAVIQIPLIVLVLPAAILWDWGVREPIVSSAHGPPFLTLGGIFLVYWIPALVLYTACRWAEERGDRQDIGGES